jgi:hypothetical protein
MRACAKSEGVTDLGEKDRKVKLERSRGRIRSRIRSWVVVKRDERLGMRKGPLF